MRHNRRRPISKASRTCDYIKLLKKEFGKSFHIHLYTPMNLVDEKSLKALYDADLMRYASIPTWTNQKTGIR
jgi:pyruvate formate-lyase activating enzyme-like uncharacterized protein